MSNNLVGIQYTANYNNLDGLSVIDADEIFIGGNQLDVANLVPYEGASKPINLNSQNIQTSHVAVAPNDLVNVSVLQSAVAYIDTSVANTFLNKTTTVGQTVAGYTTFSGGMEATQNSRFNDLTIMTPASVQGWNITASGTSGGGPYDMTFSNVQTAETIVFKDTGKIEAKGYKDTNATASKVAIFNADKELTSSGVDASKIDYLDNVSSDIQTQLNAKASITYVDSSVAGLASKTYVDAQDATRVLKAGDTITGALNWSGTPSASTNLTTKAYVDSAVATAGGQWTTAGSDIYNNNSGNVGIGKTSPGSKLDVAGSIASSNYILSVNGWGRQGDYRTGFNPSYQAGGSFGVHFGTYANNGTGNFADLLCLNTWTDSTGGQTNMIAVNKGGIGIRQWMGPFGSTTAMTTYADCVMTNANSTDVSLGSNLGFPNQGYISGNNSSGTPEVFCIPRWSDNISYINYGSGGFRIRNNSAVPTMSMTDDGRVGIGTTPVYTDLSVYRAGALGWKGWAYIGNDTTGVVLGTYDNHAYLGAHNTALSAWNNLFIAPGGLVGIGMDGSSVPTSKLEVSNSVFNAMTLTRTGASNDFGVGTVHSLISGSPQYFRGYYARTLGGSVGAVATTSQTQCNGYYVIDLAQNGIFGSDTSPYNSSYVFANTYMKTRGSITIGSVGNYEPGCIYSDVNWGMLFRAKQAGAQAQFAWYSDVGGELARMDDSGNMTITNSVNTITGNFSGVVNCSNEYRTTSTANATVMRMTAKDGSYGTIEAYEVGAYSTKRPLALQPNGGNVGIGAVDPYTKLDIYNPSSSTTISGPSARGGIHIRPNYTNDTFVALTFGGNGTSGYDTQAGITVQSSSAYGTQMIFQTTDDYSAGMKKRMAVEWTGRVSIGNNTAGVVPKVFINDPGTGTWNTGTWAYNQGLQISPDTTSSRYSSALTLSFASTYGWISCLAPGVSWKDMVIGAGTLYVAYFGSAILATNSGGWAYISDEREKEDIQDLKTTSSLKRILAVKPKHYRKKYEPKIEVDEDGKETYTEVPEEVKNKRCIGFIAQELQETNPHCVCDWEKKDAPEDAPLEEKMRLAVNYNDYVVHLCGAVQELHKRNEKQQEEIDTQKTKIDTLESSMMALIERDKLIVEHARLMEEDLKNTKKELEDYKILTEERLNKLASLVAQLIK